MRFIILFVICNALWDHTGIIPEGNKNKYESKKYYAPKKSYDGLSVGTVIDELNGVNIYFNGSLGNVEGRNVTPDGYNLGLRYQCVEFVKRYYYEVYKHKMPNSYGHAREFFNDQIGVNYNKDRGLMQYKNGGTTKPKVGDIFVFRGNRKNSFGHIGIVSMVGSDRVEMVQQNVGKHTRNLYRMNVSNGQYTVDEADLKGWMRL